MNKRRWLVGGLLVVVLVVLLGLMGAFYVRLNPNVTQELGLNRVLSVKERVEVVKTSLPVTVDAAKVNKTLTSLGWWQNGVHARTIPGYIAQKHPVKKVVVVIDNSSYKFDQQQGMVNGEAMMISSAEERLDNGTLTLYVGINQDYYNSLDSQAKQDFLIKTIARTIVTITRPHQNMEDLNQDIVKWVSQLQQEGGLINTL